MPISILRRICVGSYSLWHTCTNARQQGEFIYRIARKVTNRCCILCLPVGFVALTASSQNQMAEGRAVKYGGWLLPHSPIHSLELAPSHESRRFAALWLHMALQGLHSLRGALGVGKGIPMVGTAQSQQCWQHRASSSPSWATSMRSKRQENVAPFSSKLWLTKNVLLQPGKALSFDISHCTVLAAICVGASCGPVRVSTQGLREQAGLCCGCCR